MMDADSGEDCENYALAKTSKGWHGIDEGRIFSVHKERVFGQLKCDNPNRLSWIDSGFLFVDSILIGQSDVFIFGSQENAI